FFRPRSTGHKKLSSRRPSHYNREGRVVAYRDPLVRRESYSCHSKRKRASYSISAFFIISKYPSLKLLRLWCSGWFRIFDNPVNLRPRIAERAKALLPAKFFGEEAFFIYPF